MFQFIVKKLKNQKLLNGCLFLGLVILIAVMSLIPMFEHGALDDVIFYDFEQQALDENRYPAVISTGDKYEIEEIKSIEVLDSKVDEIIEKWNRYFEIPSLSVERIYTISGGRMEPDLAGQQSTIQIGTYNDLDKRLELIDIDADYDAESGLIPCYISKYTMEEMNLTIGENLDLEFVTDEKGESLKLRIVGIAEEKNEGDYYWYINLRRNDNTLIVSESDLDRIIKNYDIKDISFQIYEMLDYREINSNNIRATKSYVQQFTKLDSRFKCSFEEILGGYPEVAKQVKMTILSILFPLFVLLVIFIYMVSDRIADAEELDINVLRSRGISRSTIIRQYILQSLMISAAAVIPGIILGYFMCKAGASSIDFLSFKGKPTPSYTIRPEILIAVAAAFPVAVIINILPIIKASANTILTNRGKRSGNGKSSFIEKYFIDVILLGISCYLLYNYMRQRDIMVSEILSGKLADPMYLIDAEIFTFGAAFLFIRLSRLIISAIYKSGKRKWKPATLAAFLEVIRTRRKSWVISVFLIITIAMGIYNANLAKTINRNKRERLVNNIGSEMILTPTCRVVSEGKERGGGWSLSGLDYSEFLKMKDDGLVQQMTRVYETEAVKTSTRKGKVKDILLMGIDTKEFGETAVFDEMLNSRHWFYELNELAVIYDGAIISRNLADKYDVKLGDTLELKIDSPLDDSDNQMVSELDVKIVGIVDAFPGYNRYFYTEENDEKVIENERYLIVVNSAALNISYGELPPNIWMKMKTGVTKDSVENYLGEHELDYDRLLSMEEETDKVFGSAVILITNGLFNISFIVSMVICMIGFLIYWLTSIRSRQMYFGVYRAMGMGMKAVNNMLIKEHIFSTMTSLISSVIVGALTSVLFIKLISCIYLPDKHTIPLKIYMSYSGFVRIGIMMAVVIFLCMFIIISFIRKMNITEAIKMGEE